MNLDAPVALKDGQNGQNGDQLIASYTDIGLARERSGPRPMDSTTWNSWSRRAGNRQTCLRESRHVSRLSGWHG